MRLIMFGCSDCAPHGRNISLILRVSLMLPRVSHVEFVCIQKDVQVNFKNLISVI